MNNADERTNLRVANMMNNKNSIKKAIEINSQKLYPYIFLDRTNQARVTGIQVYTELFGKYKQVVLNSMVSYLISETDFKSHFESIDTHTAVLNANAKKAKTDSSSRTTSSFTPDKKEEIGAEAVVAASGGALLCKEGHRRLLVCHRMLAPS